MIARKVIQINTHVAIIDAEECFVISYNVDDEIVDASVVVNAERTRKFVFIHIENVVDILLNVDIFGNVTHWTKEDQRLELHLTHL